jgi:hypothetical protein
VYTYLAAPAALDDTLRPFDWYRDLVVAGARLLGFPPAYVVRVEIVAVEADPDDARAAEHTQLLARLTP